MAFLAGERITADRLNQEIGPAEPWQNAVLQNGWTVWGGGYGVPAYRLHAGNVELRGTIRAGTTTNGTVIFNLPALYRPSWTIQIVPRSDSASAFLEIYNDGNVTFWTGPAGALTIDGLYFPRS